MRQDVFCQILLRDKMSDRELDSYSEPLALRGRNQSGFSTLLYRQNVRLTGLENSASGR